MLIRFLIRLMVKAKIRLTAEPSRLIIASITLFLIGRLKEIEGMIQNDTSKKQTV